MSTRPSVMIRARKLAAGWRWRLNYLLGTPIPADLDADVAARIARVRRQSLTSAVRLAALCQAVEYVISNEVEGDLVECGVWRGGSMMAAALTLIELGATDRDLYLFDTYTGMPEPGAEDVSSPYDGYSPHRLWKLISGAGRTWAGAPVEAVRANLASTGYPTERMHFVEGMVEETLPGAAPERIAILRLDTDWYSSTKHELETLYPRLSERGVLIVDDYGHHAGARRAVDEYFAEIGEAPLLTRLDYTGRIAIRPPRATVSA